MRLVNTPSAISTWLIATSICVASVFNGAVLHAQEFPVPRGQHPLTSLLGPLSPLASNSSIRRAINSTVRIHKTQGRSSWYGSGTVIGEFAGNWVIMSNNHVLGDVGSTADVEFFKDGVSLGYHKAKVELSVMRNSIDIGICTVPKIDKLHDVDFTPLASDYILSVDQQLITIGCDAGHWPNLQLGRSVMSNKSLLYYLPSAYPGDSGSAVFSEDGSKVVALTAWQTNVDGTLMGLAMPIPAVRGALMNDEIGEPLPNFCFSTRYRQDAQDTPAASTQDLLDLFRRGPLPKPGDEPKPAEPEVLPPNESPDDTAIGPIGKLFEKLQDFLTAAFKTSDENSERRFRGLLDRMEKRDAEHSQRLQELEDSIDIDNAASGGFILEWRKSRQEYLLQLEKLRRDYSDQAEESQGMLHTLRSRFDNLVNFMRLLWYITIVVCVVSVIGIFAGPAWASKLIIAFFRSVFSVVGTAIGRVGLLFGKSDSGDISKAELMRRLDELSKAMEAQTPKDD